MDSELTDLLNNYKVPEKGHDVLKRTKVVFLVGISGAGKNTILKQLLKTNKYKLIISHTTRLPRKNHGVMEQSGKEYHFIDKATAKRMLLDGKFIEAKLYSGNIYGTSIEEVESAYRKGEIAISDIEVQGVAEYMKADPNVIPIFILPPDFDTWRRRLRDRYKGLNFDWKEMEKRLETAKVELKEALSKDYFEFVINDDLQRSVIAVDRIVHGHLSPTKNEHARQVAQELLHKLSA